jgi:UDP-N-acetylglucosamine--N-acetylmuramyl-(pentapeptide) pyrophosphoryl-undecaprenol N-acetylglucosamine transferase
VKVLIAGGGTGGHFFSGVAVGEAWLSRDPKTEIVYVGTKQGIEARVGPKLGLAMRYVSVSGIKGKGPLARLRAVLRLPVAMAQSFALVLRERPQAVLGVGGYASGPVVLAARLLGKATGVVEQNSVAGATNRILGRFVDRVFVAFSEAGTAFPARKVVVTGNPVRERMVQTLMLDSTGSVGLGAKLRVLVLGGSQGARRVNEVMVQAVSALPQATREALVLVHQTGVPDEDTVRDGYARAGFAATVLPFIDDVAEAYRAADLVVCRAGALTVSELGISRRAAVFIPFPFAIDNHQERNAQTLVDADAALMIRESELTPQRLAETIDGLHHDRKRLQRMAWNAGALARPQAAAEVADEMCRLAGGA